MKKAKLAAAPNAKTTKATKAAPSTEADAAMAKLLVKLDGKLKTYAPTRHRAIRGATSFAVLEKVATVGPRLRALWAWLDGGPAGEALWQIEPDVDAAWESMLSVQEAAAATQQLRKQAQFPRDLVPFATDGGGNFLVANEQGVVFDWDHETCKPTEYGPLSAIVHVALKAIAAGELFGGPEQTTPAAESAKERTLINALTKAAQPQRALEKLVEFTRGLPDAAGVAILLRPEVQNAIANERPHERHAWARALAERCAKLQRWDDVITYGSMGTAMVWSELGTLAWQQPNLEAALRCYEAGSSSEVRGPVGMNECFVGAACAAAKLRTKSAAALLTKACKTVDKQLKEAAATWAKVSTWTPAVAAQKGYLPVHIDRAAQVVAELRLLRATLAVVANEKPLAKQLLRERDALPPNACKRHDRIAHVIDSTLATL
ncbi:MAG TPA: SMI1/KNR4 family protein [Kofleriaceae bacterium]|nr:SMI1/KNR4 family protein [Kofleriaceae bacterium]